MRFLLIAWLMVSSVVGMCDIDWTDVISQYNSLYFKLSHLYNNRFPSNPTFIYRPHSEADVSKAVCLSRELGLRLVPRGGGHSYIASSTCPDRSCILMDMSNLNEIVYDPDKQTIQVGAGAKNSDVFKAAREIKRSIPTGLCGPVGVGGLVLGGGFGFLSHEHDLTMDNLLSISVVLADGKIVVADQKNHPDLFWALRGAGHQSFGVATQFIFQTHSVVGKHQFLQYKVTHPREALVRWQHWSTEQFDGVFTRFTLGNYMTDHTIHTIVVIYKDDDQWMEKMEASGLLEFMRRDTCHDPNTIQPAKCNDLTWDEISMLNAGCGNEIGGISFVSKSNFGATFLEPAQADDLVNVFETINLEGCIPDWAFIDIDRFGGAIHNVKKNDTAFPHRDKMFMYQVLAKSMDHEMVGPCHNWVNKTHDVLTRLVGSTDAYNDYEDLELQDWQHDYYGDNYDRLREIKHNYDPTNFFQFDQSIEPLSS